MWKCKSREENRASSISRSPLYLCSLYHFCFFSFCSCIPTICNVDHQPFLSPIPVCSQRFGLMLGGHSNRSNQHEHISLCLTLSDRNLLQFASLTRKKKPSYLLICEQLTSFPSLLLCGAVWGCDTWKLPTQLNVSHSRCLLTGQIINYQLS